MMKEYTKNGIEYTYEITSRHGAHFVLFPEDHHSTEQIKEAKHWLRNERDVVSLRIANKYDLYNRFRDEVFRDPRTKPLHWSQIEFDFEDWAKNRRITAQEFVTERLESWKANRNPTQRVWGFDLQTGTKGNTPFFTCNY